MHVLCTEILVVEVHVLNEAKSLGKNTISLKFNEATGSRARQYIPDL